MIVSGSTTSCTGLLSLPQGPNNAVGAQPTKCAGPRRNLRGPYNCTPDGSRKPSPQVLRRVRLSSNGCQRTPNLRTAAFLSYLIHSSSRTPSPNSTAQNPGTFH